MREIQYCAYALHNILIYAICLSKLILSIFPVTSNLAIIVPCAGLSSLWISSSGWADINITDLQSNVTTALLKSRVSCPDFFCNHSQQVGDIALAAGSSYLLEATHQHWQGPSHFLLSAVGNATNSRLDAGREYLQIATLPICIHASCSLLSFRD